jgi:hypothetical protein
MNIKKCSVCQIEKTSTDFYKDISKKSRTTSACRDCCKNKSMTRYGDRIEEKHRIERRSYYVNVYRFKVYGITKDDFDRLLMLQNNRCICGISFETQTACIDHDHSCCSGNKSCGECVRGLLCQRCNRIAGSVYDNPETLRLLANYLEKGTL